MKRKGNIMFGGGKHQRLARILAIGGMAGQGASSSEASLPQQNPGRGPLDGDDEVDALIELWALGLISATVLQMIAAAACNVAPRPQMQVLKALGTSGIHANNAHRDLERKLNLGRLDRTVAPPLMVDFPLREARARPPQKVCMKYPVILPHELLALMYAENRSELHQFILGTTPLDTWWANMPADDPRYIGHLVNRIADKSCVVPLRLHGDGVPIGRAKKRTLDVVSFGSMVGKQGCTWDTKLLVFTVTSAAKWSGDHENAGTMALVWKILLWSFGVLMERDMAIMRLEWNSG